MAAIIQKLRVAALQHIEKEQDLLSRNNKGNQLQQQNKRQIVALQKEVDELKIKDPYLLFRKQGNNHIIDELKTEIEYLYLLTHTRKKSFELNHLINSVMLKDKKISELERKIKDTQYELFLAQDRYEKDIQEWKVKLQVKQDEMNQVILMPTPSPINLRRSSSVYRSQTTILPREENSKQHAILEQDEECSENEVPIISKEEVVDLCRSLRQINIPMKELDQYLFAYEEDNEISIVSLMEAFQKYSLCVI